jgi:Holliday junction resolvase RusA-like endonuclease
MIEFEVPGPAVAKARPRIVTLTSKSGRAFSHAYTPKKSVNYENWIKMCFQRAVPSDWEPYSGPVELLLRIYIAIPASFSKKKRQLALDGVIFPETKPDVDNYLKIYMDSLSGFCFLDDKQVVHGAVGKMYATESTAFVRIECPAPARVSICRG